MNLNNTNVTHLSLDQAALSRRQELTTDAFLDPGFETLEWYIRVLIVFWRQFVALCGWINAYQALVVLCILLPYLTLLRLQKLTKEVAEASTIAPVKTNATNADNKKEEESSPITAKQDVFWVAHKLMCKFNLMLLIGIVLPTFMIVTMMPEALWVAALLAPHGVFPKLYMISCFCLHRTWQEGVYRTGLAARKLSGRLPTKREKRRARFRAHWASLGFLERNRFVLSQLSFLLHAVTTLCLHVQVINFILISSAGPLLHWYVWTMVLFVLDNFFERQLLQLIEYLANVFKLETQPLEWL